MELFTEMEMIELQTIQDGLYSADCGYSMQGYGFAECTGCCGSCEGDCSGSCAGDCNGPSDDCYIA